MKRNERGAALIEMMVSLLVLAVGLLGVLAMQVQSLKANQNAYLYSQSAFLANDIYESMNLFPYNAADFAINFSATTPTLPECTLSDSNCTKKEVITWSQSSWRANIEKLLPGGKGAVVMTDGAYEIQIKFIVGYDQAGEAETEIYALKTGLL